MRKTTNQNYSNSSVFLHKDGLKIMNTGSPGLSQNLSSSMLLHSSTAHSFPKGIRFTRRRIDYEDVTQIQLPSLQSTRYTNFGFGKKNLLPQHVMRNAKEIPPPNSYNLQGSFRSDNNLGKSFGLSYQAYARVYMPGTNVMTPEALREIPGPGTYKVPDTIGKNSRVTLKSKGKLFSHPSNETKPTFFTYSPGYRLVDSSRFSRIGFGFGSKTNVAKALNKNPGPGNYNAFSQFDYIVKKKYERQKRREQLRRKEEDKLQMESEEEEHMA